MEKNLNTKAQNANFPFSAYFTPPPPHFIIMGKGLLCAQGVYMTSSLQIQHYLSQARKDYLSLFERMQRYYTPGAVSSREPRLLHFAPSGELCNIIVTSLENHPIRSSPQLSEDSRRKLSCWDTK